MRRFERNYQMDSDYYPCVYHNEENSGAYDSARLGLEATT